MTSDTVTSKRGRRKEQKGFVISRSGDKTVVVRVERRRRHPLYGKVIREFSKLHAHDEENAAKVGDLVRVVESRPMSRMKRWRVTDIIEKVMDQKSEKNFVFKTRIR